MKKRKTSRRRAQTTVWQALNEPIAYPSDEFARTVFLMTAVIMMMIWIAPYWGTAAYSVERSAYSGSVAGEIIENLDPIPYTLSATPEWYDTMQRASSDVVTEFGLAAQEVLDISEPVTQTVEFYEPGVDAVWNAWVDLMADPY